MQINDFFVFRVRHLEIHMPIACRYKILHYKSQYWVEVPPKESSKKHCACNDTSVFPYKGGVKGKRVERMKTGASDVQRSQEGER